MSDAIDSQDRPALEDEIDKAVSNRAANPGQADIIDPVSPEMAKAGVYEIRDWPIGSDLAEVVTAVYMAMEYERRDSHDKGGCLVD